MRLRHRSDHYGKLCTTVKQYCYYYEYDSRGRCTKKQLPGCDYVTMTYDTDDRLISSQDGNQRNASSPTTTYYEYDALGRQTVMGIEYSSSSTKIPYCKYFYDDYSFLTTTESTKVGFDSSNGYESTYASAKGLQTGCRLLHLDNPSTSEVTAMYYNAYGEMIQKRSTNHLSGNDDEYIQYNHYTGKELNHKHIHSASGQTTHTEVYTYEYDSADQLHYIKHKLDNNTQVTLSTITYDNIGRVATKGGTLNTETYSYNIRDWVKKIENSQFYEYIGYNDTSGDAVPTNKFYNGNIGAIKWKAGGETTARTYQFNYNALDWLTSATYSGPGSYSTTYTYDKMGNMLTLTRYGKYSGSTYQLIDNLTFSYTGNQPNMIQDQASDPSYSGAFNFNDHPINIAGEYTYDKNGNLKNDSNKYISSIQYNFLNLPTKITYSTGKSASYIYNGAGEKLRTSYKASASATAVPTDYCGNMIYENGVLKQILVDGGYMTVTGTPFYFYYLKDHLGNNRVVISPAGTATQINHYYPFGGLFGESTGSTGQRYKYNGKEFDRTHGLDWYDYGARHMSPDVGRFTTIDPMAEKYYSISPYAYCGNNPVNAIDPDGKSTWVKALEDGTYQVIGGDIDDDDRNIYLYNQDSNGDYTVKGEAIGVTSSTTSFYNSDKNEWRNSIINPSDISGKVFLGKIFKDPNIISYMDKARKDNEYDFKVTNGTPGKKDLDIYRGMPIGQTKEGMTIYTSARDIGNIAAGYVAAVNGLTWGVARLGFDLYQKGIEGASTQNAQYYGWRYGRKSMPFGKQRFNSSDPYIIP